VDWIISLTSCFMLWLMGNKSIWGPVVGIANQGLWIFYVIWTSQWGLMLGVILYTFVHLRNLMKWWRKPQEVDKKERVQEDA